MDHFTYKWLLSKSHWLAIESVFMVMKGELLVMILMHSITVPHKKYNREIYRKWTFVIFFFFQKLFGKIPLATFYGS